MEKFKNLIVLNRRKTLILISVGFASIALLKIKDKPFVTTFEVELGDVSQSLKSNELRTILNLDMDPQWYKNYEMVRGKFLSSGKILNITKNIDLKASKATFQSHWANKQALKDFYREAQMQSLLDKLENRSARYSLVIA